MKKILFILVIFNFQLSIFNSLQAQANRHQLRDGNRNYKNEKYDKAEVEYRRALESDSLDFRGQYSLANSLYRQKKYDEAVRHYDQALQLPDLSDKQRWQSLHNKGNAYLKSGMENKEQGMQLFQQAIKSYQDALKVDPKNDDTRYNLAYARRLLQQAQQQQQQQQNQQNGDQNKDQQNKDQQHSYSQTTSRTSCFDAVPLSRRLSLVLRTSSTPKYFIRLTNLPASSVWSSLSSMAICVESRAATALLQTSSRLLSFTSEASSVMGSEVSMLMPFSAMSFSE